MCNGMDGMVDGASKIDRLLRRSELVDSRRHRAHVRSWQTRSPYTARAGVVSPSHSGAQRRDLVRGTGQQTKSAARFKQSGAARAAITVDWLTGVLEARWIERNDEAWKKSQRPN
jgi:hypothetical protein